MPAADNEAARAVGGIAEPETLGLVASPIVPSGIRMGEIAPLFLSMPPPMLPKLSAPGQIGGHGMATPKFKDSGTRPSAAVVLTVSVTYPQSEDDVADTEAPAQVALAGGVLINIHRPSSDTAIPVHIPEPNVAVVPSRNAACACACTSACAARSTTVDEPVSVIVNTEAAVAELESATGRATCSKANLTTASTAVRLRTASVKSLLPVSRRICSVPLRESPRRGDRMRPKSVTRIASSHKGHIVDATDTGSAPFAIDRALATLSAESGDMPDEVTRQTSSPSPRAEPKYALTAFVTPRATGASELGSQDTGPIDVGVEENSAW